MRTTIGTLMVIISTVVYPDPIRIPVKVLFPVEYKFYEDRGWIHKTIKMVDKQGCRYKGRSEFLPVLHRVRGIITRSTCDDYANQGASFYIVGKDGVEGIPVECQKFSVDGQCRSATLPKEARGTLLVNSHGNVRIEKTVSK